MNRRRFLQVAAATGTGCVAGCIDDAVPAGTASPTDPGAGARPEKSPDESPDDTPMHGSPGSPYDFLFLYELPDYVTEYSESVVVQYDESGSAAQRAVQQALASDEGYREPTTGGEQTDVMALFSHIERRWEQTGGESFEHTYLHYEGSYYGINLVQEGDFVRIDSVPCTDEACPTTPTPPA